MGYCRKKVEVVSLLCWDSNQGQQDVRRRQIHWAMTALPHPKGCLGKSTPYKGESQNYSIYVKTESGATEAEVGEDGGHYIRC